MFFTSYPQTLLDVSWPKANAHHAERVQFVRMLCELGVVAAMRGVVNLSGVFTLVVHTSDNATINI